MRVYPEEHVRPLLERGLRSGDEAIKARALGIQERLLRQGLSEYLGLDAPN
jgi:hypothetical protein